METLARFAGPATVRLGARIDDIDGLVVNGQIVVWLLDGLGSGLDGMPPSDSNPPSPQRPAPLRPLPPLTLRFAIP